MTDRKKVEINSLLQTRYAIIGEVIIDGELFCYSLEKKWHNNKRRVSCIPAGEYKTTPYSSDKYPNVCEIIDVEGRSKILIHAANYDWQLLGCIALGANYVETFVTNGKECSAVFNSKKTIEEFYNKVGYDFDLIIDSKFRGESTTCSVGDDINSIIQ